MWPAPGSRASAPAVSARHNICAIRPLLPRGRGWFRAGCRFRFRSGRSAGLAHILQQPVDLVRLRLRVVLGREMLALLNPDERRIEIASEAFSIAAFLKAVASAPDDTGRDAEIAQPIRDGQRVMNIKGADLADECGGAAMARIVRPVGIDGFRCAGRVVMAPLDEGAEHPLEGH